MSEVLYHYTSKYHLPMIMKDGFLQLTESNLIAPKDYQDALPKELSQLYKPVVWLTNSSTPQGNGIEGSSLNKYEIRITVKRREHYENWVLWSKKNRIKSSWFKTLASAGNPYSWYISESMIPLNGEELIRIENTISGEVLIDVENGLRTYSQKVEKPANFSMVAYKKFLKDKVELGEVVILNV